MLLIRLLVFIAIVAVVLCLVAYVFTGKPHYIVWARKVGLILLTIVIGVFLVMVAERLLIAGV